MIKLRQCATKAILPVTRYKSHILVFGLTTLLVGSISRIDIAMAQSISGDINNDGIVGAQDLSIVLSNWGKSSSDSPTPLASPTATIPSDSSGEAMPVGNVTSNGVSWKMVMSNDFNAPPTENANGWKPYPDGSGEGKYNATDTITTKNGIWNWNIHPVGNKMVGAAGIWGTPYTYMRTSMRLRTDKDFNGAGLANMMWPASDKWGDGEIDYPEGNYMGTMHAYHHPINCTDCSSSDGIDSGVKYSSGWHTVTTEWTAKSVIYMMDGRVIKTVTHDIPTKPHDWRIQSASDGSPISAGGNLQIAWVAQWTQ